jgi:hypothetical protein
MGEDTRITRVLAYFGYLGLKARTTLTWTTQFLYQVELNCHSSLKHDALIAKL